VQVLGSFIFRFIFLIVRRKEIPFDQHLGNILRVGSPCGQANHSVKIVVFLLQSHLIRLQNSYFVLFHFLILYHPPRKTGNIPVNGDSILFGVILHGVMAKVVLIEIVTALHEFMVPMEGQIKNVRDFLLLLEKVSVFHVQD
jgi:hypothetical protein